ncbi:MAG: Hsp20/alpha crystallin family protein [Candidatus Pacebacteria bacterium]|nr:Hsp20/alpha crystallin family protein [Candidatus Paceibacterota bacterium]
MSNEFLNKLKKGTEQTFKKIEVEPEIEKPAPEKPKEEERKPWLEQDGQPVMDMYQQGTELIIQSALAGIEVNDVEITVENDTFIIKGKRENPAKSADKYFLKECFWGNFCREIILPVEVDSSRTEAEIKNGILIITIPILEKGKKKIAIKE